MWFPPSIFLLNSFFAEHFDFCSHDQIYRGLCIYNLKPSFLLLYLRDQIYAATKVIGFLSTRFFARDFLLYCGNNAILERRHPVVISGNGGVFICLFIKTQFQLFRIPDFRSFNFFCVLTARFFTFLWYSAVLSKAVPRRSWSALRSHSTLAWLL